VNVVLGYELCVSYAGWKYIEEVGNVEYQHLTGRVCFKRVIFSAIFYCQLVNQPNSCVQFEHIIGLVLTDPAHDNMFVT
jgi:hypothetical protein